MSRRRLFIGGVVISGLALSALPGCKVGYLLRSGYYQAELLALREPIDEVRATGELSPEELEKLELIADVKAFGGEIGLSATDNYETISVDWERQIWNVSACHPTRFEPKKWWFPIVGSFPYLGFFREEDARELEAELRADGLDTYVRKAGAYSTLGWFKDPILPKMLSWTDYKLADTVLHELAHATLWVPGSVKFNESYANFVGEVAAMRYLAARRGHHDPALIAAVQLQADRRLFREVQHELYKDLQAVYEDESLTDAERLAAKGRLFGEDLQQRVGDAPFHDPERYAQAVRQGTWNNARMVQFKTYNTKSALFAAVLEQVDGDLLAFIEQIEIITKGADDPFEALEAHVQES